LDLFGGRNVHYVKIGEWTLLLDANSGAIRAYNKIHEEIKV
jgi:hypothetical protein